MKRGILSIQAEMLHLIDKHGGIPKYMIAIMAGTAYGRFREMYDRFSFLGLIEDKGKREIVLTRKGHDMLINITNILTALGYDMSTIGAEWDRQALRRKDVYTRTNKDAFPREEWAINIPEERNIRTDVSWSEEKIYKVVKRRKVFGNSDTPGVLLTTVRCRLTLTEALRFKNELNRNRKKTESDIYWVEKDTCQ